uniref:Uncharacterized protein n=1 Tax=Bionectria ochroleuca TaxID=29856 RepID=A0A8H7TSE2_BIOOC
MISGSTPPRGKWPGPRRRQGSVHRGIPAEEDEDTSRADQSTPPGPDYDQWHWQLGCGRDSLPSQKIHPEQYCDDFNDEEINTLYQNIRYVCQTAVDKLGDSDEFPDHWLFNYRWGKGAKDTATKLPNGEKLAFITVGGRTSCYAPGVQKKTGRVAPGVKEETVESAKKDPPKKGPVKKEAPKPRKPSRKAPQKIKDEEQSGESDAEPPKKKIRSKALDKAHKKPSTVPKEIQEAPVEGRRRSTRLSGKSGDAQTSSYW